MRRALTLPLGVLLLLAADSCGGGVSGPDGGRPILGDCAVVPNYIPQVILNRWRQFPLRYHLIESTLPMEDRDWILERIVDGIHRWSISTNGRIGSLSATSSPDGADFVIVVVEKVREGRRARSSLDVRWD